MNTATRHVARDAEANPALRTLARAGYAADGLVHLLTGTIVLVVTFGGEGESDQTGAFKAVAAAPLGFVVLWVLAVALWALAAYHVFEAMLARGDSSAKKWARRLGEVGQVVAFAALGVIAAVVAAGAHPNGERSVETLSGDLIAASGGPLLLGAIGLGVAIAGATFTGFGTMRRFREHTGIPPGPPGIAVTVVGGVGYIAKGIALVIVGALLVVASVTLDADVAGGMDGAVNALLELPYGRWLGGAVGIGLLAYGLFLFARARYARL
ncbi:DUF1206 domain-containing protein [Microbacterium sp. CPCC 204701]|uniref:DUF1206 domain-containing protein n=1 Tax=Microbacterium sp. CPCC 204701 TaxID=2493084 RepID=UPI000FD9937B|nr:DUF1206 domain-containing protein [Microbacterium sp. CPCC 204701]